MAECHGISLNFWPTFGAFLAVYVVVTSGEVCRKKGTSPCACSNSKGTIDLSKLSTGTSPRWKQLPSSTDQYLYSYDPCTPFSETPGTFSGCTSVLGCQTTKAGTAHSPLADPTQSWSINGDVEDGNLVFEYQALAAAGVYRRLHVELHCSDEDARLVVVGEQPPNSMIYKVQLYSVYACYDGVYPRPGGVSFGTILCIICFLGLLVYCLGGFLFLTYVRHAQGAERFPNVEFWRDFPHLVRDGTLFLFRGCKTETTYDRI